MNTYDVMLFFALIRFEWKLRLNTNLHIMSDSECNQVLTFCSGVEPYVDYQPFDIAHLDLDLSERR